MSIAGWFLTDLCCQDPHEVYHIQKQRKDGFILTSILISAGFVFSLVILFGAETLTFLAIIPGVLIMMIMAICDLRFERIPHILLGIAIIFAIYFGLITSRLTNQFAGGVLGLVLGLVIFMGGNAYVYRRYPDNGTLVAFGLGDVTGAACLGFLLGFPSGFWAFLIALVLAVIIKSIISAYQKQKLSLTTVRLGPFFYAGYLLVAFVNLVTTTS